MSDGEKRCSNCGGVMGAGSAQDLDARCYQYRRRNGHLPPPQRFATGDNDESYNLRIPSDMLKQAKAAAKRKGVQLSVWLRDSIKAQLEVEK